MEIDYRHAEKSKYSIFLYRFLYNKNEKELYKRANYQLIREF